jgi:hypothetical protein
MTDTFKRNSLIKRIWWALVLFYKKLKNPENVWYGNGLKRDTAIHCVGEGWRKLVSKLYDAKPKSTHVMQVKEKWGGLRFYVSSAPEWYYDLIDCYEQESYQLCELCGEQGVNRTDLGWVLTLCDKHYLEIKNK